MIHTLRIGPLKAKPLTAEAFAPYGDVIETSEMADQFSINYGNTTRYNDLMQMDVADEGGAPCVNIFRSHPLPQPVTIKIMENHPLGSQAFVPLSGRPYLVVVAEAGPFVAANIKAFLAGSNQGVNYHKGVWHHYCLALDKTSDFLVIDRKGKGENCVEYLLSATEQVVISL